jgi:hypothetical protein
MKLRCRWRYGLAHYEIEVQVEVRGVEVVLAMFHI